MQAPLIELDDSLILRIDFQGNLRRWTLRFDSQVLVMSREQFNAELGDLGQMRSVWRFEVLRRVPLLNELEPAVLGELSQALETHEFKPGQDVVVEQFGVCDAKVSGEVKCLWVDGWTDGRLDGWMGGCGMNGCVGD
eukprot:366124-Chlamydomonas_euryale.AAC.5